MKAIRIGICILVAFAVLSFGAVEEWSEAVLEVGAAALLLYWSILFYRERSERIVVSPFFLPLTAIRAGGFGRDPLSHLCVRLQYPRRASIVDCVSDRHSSDESGISKRE